ncbi:Serine/threonine-protein phosphatase BSL2 [Linum grandiflorum]
MDVDSSMASDADQDTTAQNVSSSAAAREREQQLSEDPQPVGSATDTASLLPPPSPPAQQSTPEQAQVQQHSTVVGPRPAPTYSVVNAIIEKKEDGPGSRCGHTLTAVAAVGEEGTPAYIGPRLILFGGATGLEGNSGTSTPTSAGGAGIRLSGATADVHCYDVLTNKWSRISPIGEPPTPRAAHVATAVGTMVVIQGGIGPAGLSAEDLHVLDLTQQHPRWHRVVVQGPGPGPRYGHVMALVGQRYLMAIGGNDGKRPLSDVWALDTAAKPYEWRKLEPEGEGPPPCM